MKKAVSRLFRGFHLLLCVLGIHSVEPVWKFDGVLGEFEQDGRFCPVCTKTWENN